MKLHEALKHPKVVAGDMWIRPVGWEKIPVAYAVRDGGSRNASVISVPSANGGRLGITFHVDELAGEWEVVEPSVVLDCGKIKT